MSENTYIVWDLGATKCAAALVMVNAGQYTILKSHRVKLKSFQSLDDMAAALHEALGVRPFDVDGICIAAAGQYNGCELILDSQYPYPMKFADLAQRQQWAVFTVIHDYTPIVCSTYVEQSNVDNVMTLNAGLMDPWGHRVAFGVGSGLGVKHAVKLASGQLALGINEMGHIGLGWPPRMTLDEETVHSNLMRFLVRQRSLRGNDMTFESILSGRGLARIYQFVTGRKAPLSPEETAAEIQASGEQETLSLFAWYLGVFIGTLQLTFMPAAGVWMYGGVIHKNLILFEEPYLYNLQRGIKSCGAYWERRQHFPLHVLIGQEHAFLGAAYYAQQHLVAVAA